ncbi:hypothetical protein [Streptomyces sp. NPDC020742]|uniref:hypothetical protein n=1 Tax=Streptomyces sp. NPDC020742 TaxID=3154897 RepID=UPI0033EC53C7
MSPPATPPPPEMSPYAPGPYDPGLRGPGVPDRKETEVRRLLAGPRPPLPPDLAARAAYRGRRLLARRRLLRRLGLLLALLVLAGLLGPAARAALTREPAGPPRSPGLPTTHTTRPWTGAEPNG